MLRGHKRQGLNSREIPLATHTCLIKANCYSYFKLKGLLEIVMSDFCFFIEDN